LLEEKMEKENIDSRFKELLREAARYRFFSLCFQPPRPGLKEEIENIYAEIGKSEIFNAFSINEVNPDNEHHPVLGAGGACSSCESEYVGDRLGGKGLLMADIAGFYKAFSFIPEIEFRAPVDNISMEFSFLSYITLKEAFALYRGQDKEIQICADAKEKFQKEHLLPWVYLFVKKLIEVNPDSFYARISLIMEDFLNKNINSHSLPVS